MRLGIFGGTFNPPHLGHLALVSAVADKMELQRVLIIPAAVPPHKAAPDLAGGEDRLEMCRLTFGGDERFMISDIELKRKGKSYTYDTLKEIKKLYPDDELFLIIGSDMLVTFDRWYRYGDILRLATLCAAARQEAFKPDLESIFSADELCRVEYIETAVLPMSSTEIRAKISAGESTSGYLEESTAQYISQRGLYK